MRSNKFSKRFSWTRYSNWSRCIDWICQLKRKLSFWEIYWNY